MKDWYAYCDICGQRYLASKTSKLSTYTGRGGLVVCKHDTDRIDPGLIPFLPRREKSVPYIRINHTDITDGSPEVDYESMTYSLFLVTSQDNAFIASSQDEAKLIISEPI